jgi:hypothetical protein
MAMAATAGDGRIIFYLHATLAPFFANLFFPPGSAMAFVAGQEGGNNGN